MNLGLAPYRKFATAMAGAWLTFAYIALGYDLIPEPYATWVLVVILTAQAIGVYVVPNKPDVKPPFDVRSGWVE